MDYRQIKAKEMACREALIREFPTVCFMEGSGIYVFRRIDQETGLKFAYVGQAKKMTARIVQHCMGYDSHIDKSLKKRKFYNDQNRGGWIVDVATYCSEDRLDDQERFWIKYYADEGYQLYNKTSGGQDGGKIGIAPNAPARGYRDGLKQGYENARRDVAKLFEKNLRAEINGAPNKLKERAMEKFEEFIKIYKKI